MRFLLDAQLPPALAEWLRNLGHDTCPLREVGLREADDGEIWRYAEENGWVIMTKDEDFALWAQEKETGPIVVWLRLGNSSNRALRAWLEPRLPGVVQLASGGSRLIEVV